MQTPVPGTQTLPDGETRLATASRTRTESAPVRRSAVTTGYDAASSNASVAASSPTATRSSDVAAAIDAPERVEW